MGTAAIDYTQIYHCVSILGPHILLVWHPGIHPEVTRTGSNSCPASRNRGVRYLCSVAKFFLQKYLRNVDLQPVTRPGASGEYNMLLLFCGAPGYYQ
jgi:hypothetical protein